MFERIWLAALAAAGLFASGPAASQATGGAPPLEAYGNRPAIESVTLSPSGKRFAFIAMDGADRKLFVRNVGGAAVLTAKVGDNKIRGIAWAGDDTVLVTVSATVKPKYLDYLPKEPNFESRTILCFNVATGKSIRVFDKSPRGRALFFDAVIGDYGYRKVGERWYGYLSAITEDRDHDIDLYRVDLETGEGELAARGGANGRNWVVGSDGAILVELDYISATRDARILAGDGGKVILTRRAPIGGIAIGGPGRTAGTFILEDSTGKRDRVEEVAVGAPGASALLIDDESVDSYLHDPVSGQVIGAITDHADDVVLFDPKLKARYAALRKAFPGLHVVPVSYTTGFDKVIAKTDGGDDAGTYWLVDLTTGQASELAEAYPTVSHDKVGPTSIFSYNAADGLALEHFPARMSHIRHG
jgi:hypothetical protein